MNRVVTTIALASLICMSSVGSFAQGSGGGSGATTNPEVAGCAQRGEDGKPVRKLSSEDVCPMYQFWREDCGRLAKLNPIPPEALLHCSAAALGLSDTLTTGSVSPR